MTQQRPRPAARRRRHLIRIALPATILTIAMVSAAPGTGDVYAADVFGGLRAPGEAAFIAGHRGDRSAAPENTMPAFEAALANPALAFVEADVQLTRDGVPVLFHDRTLDRITGRPGSVGDLTWAELRRLDAGAWFSPEFAGTRIPRLTELLSAVARTDKAALIELKEAWNADEVRRVVDEIAASSLGGRVVLESFSIETLDTIAVVAPRMPRMMLARELPPDPVPMARRFGVIAVATTARAITATPEAVQRLHEAEIGVLCYTLNTEKTWAGASALGVDGIITDVPSALDAWLASTARGT